MSDDLVKRLRAEAEGAEFSNRFADMVDEAADRIEELEAKLGEVVSMALEECPFRDGTGSYNDWWHDRRITLAKIKERSDDETS